MGAAGVAYSPAQTPAGRSKREANAANCMSTARNTGEATDTTGTMYEEYYSPSCVAREHRPDQVLAMREARDHHRCDMCQHQGKRQVSEDIVHVLQSFGAFFADDACEEAALVLSAVYDHSRDYGGS